jgi:hypothetical protein
MTRDEVKRAIEHFRYMQQWSKDQAAKSEGTVCLTVASLYQHGGFVFGNCAEYLERRIGVTHEPEDDSDRVAFETGEGTNG